MRTPVSGLGLVALERNRLLRSDHGTLPRQLSILSIGLLLSHPFRANLRCISDPQLKPKLVQQSLKPACVPAGLHPHAHTPLFQPPVKLLGLVKVSQPPFATLTCFRIHKCNLLEARMIVTTYNQHVRLLSSEPFGWFAPPKFTRTTEPTLLWNHCSHQHSSCCARWSMLRSQSLPRL